MNELLNKARTGLIVGCGKKSKIMRDFLANYAGKIANYAGNYAG